MYNKRQQDYYARTLDVQRKEKEFFRSRLDMFEFVENELGFAFVPGKTSKSRQQSERVYEGPNGQKYVVSLETNGNYVWCLLGGGKGGPSGNLFNLIAFVENLGYRDLSKDNVVRVNGILREYSRRRYGIEFDGATGHKDKTSGTGSINFQSKKVQSPPAPKQVDPATRTQFHLLSDTVGNLVESTGLREPHVLVKTVEGNADYLKFRQISNETIQSPLFKNQILEATGKLGGELKKGKNTLTTDLFEFERHILFPYRDNEGHILAVEAKNRYKADVFADLTKNDAYAVKRNESRFYEGSSRGVALWMSDSPDATVMVLGEQPIDLLSYYQLNVHEANLRNALYVATGGRPTAEHVDLIKTILNERGIAKLVIAADNDIPGQVYSLNYLIGLNSSNERSKINLSISETEIGLEKARKHNNQVLLRVSVGPWTRDNQTRLEQFLKLEAYIKNKFKGGGITINPAYSVANEQVMTVFVPGVNDNFRVLHELVNQIYRIDKAKYEIQFPENHKDYNDQLMDKRSVQDPKLLPVFDFKSYLDQIYIKSTGGIVVPNQYINIENQVLDEIGVLAPFSTERVKLSTNTIMIPGLQEKLDQLIARFNELVPTIDDKFIKAAITRNIEYDAVTKSFVRDGEVLATRQGLSFVGEPTASVTQLDKIALAWMSESLEARGLISPVYIQMESRDKFYQGMRLDIMYDLKAVAAINTHYSIDLGNIKQKGVPNFVLGQIDLVEAAIGEVKRQYNRFRDYYPQPLSGMVESSNKLFYVDKTAIFEFDDKTKTVQPVATNIQDLYFHPYVWKALNVFQQEEGRYLNYTRLAFIDADAQTVHYGKTKQLIGHVYTDANQKRAAFFYDFVPANVRAELQLQTGWNTGNYYDAIKSGHTIDLSATTKKFKEKKIDLVPLAYTPFFDGAKLKRFGKEETTKWPDTKKRLYSDAQQWVQARQKEIQKLDEKGEVQNIMSAISTKPSFREENGRIFFGKYPIGMLDSQQDTINYTFNVSIGKHLLPQLAILERSLITNPANRKYQEYLPGSSAQPDHATEELPDELLKRINLNKATGDVLVHGSGGSFMRPAVVMNDRMYVSTEMKSFSDQLDAALNKLSRTLGKQIEYVDQLPGQNPVQAVKEVEDKQARKYDHVLNTNPDGLLVDLVRVPGFQKAIEMRDGNIHVAFLMKNNAVTRTLVDADFTKYRDQVWMTNQKQPRSLVVAQDPKVALQHAQHLYPTSIHSKDIYLSIPGRSDGEVAKVVANIATLYKAPMVQILGTPEFLKTHTEVIQKQLPLMPVTPVDVSKLSNSLANLQNFLAPYKPSSDVQRYFDTLDNTYSIYNPAQGVLLFPMQSAGGSSVAVLSDSLHKSSDINSVWISGDPNRAARVVLVADQEEAFYYQLVNRNTNSIIVGFQGEVTKPALDYVNSRIESPHLMDQVFIANTNRLVEKVKSIDPTFAYKLERPSPQSNSFKEEFISNIKDPELYLAQFEVSTRKYNRGELIAQAIKEAEISASVGQSKMNL